jgi:hypothetical protein
MMDLLMSDENAGLRERAKELDYQLMHWLSHTNKGAKTGVKAGAAANGGGCRRAQGRRTLTGGA